MGWGITRRLPGTRKAAVGDMRNKRDFKGLIGKRVGSKERNGRIQRGIRLLRFEQ